LRDAGGGIVGLMSISRDITEQKLAEGALRESNRRLEEALAELKATQEEVLHQERLCAMGQMASGIAHNFNNALAPILGYTEVLLKFPEQLDDKGRVVGYLRSMNTAARDAAHMVRRLIEFYRPRSNDELFVSVDVNALVEEATMLTEPRWKDQALARGVAIHMATDLERMPRISGSPAEIREVLTNLIFNAVDALPGSGTITIRTRAKDNHVLLEVGDTGTGMIERSGSGACNRSSPRRSAAGPAWGWRPSTTSSSVTTGPLPSRATRPRGRRSSFASRSRQSRGPTKGNRRHRLAGVASRFFWWMTIRRCVRS
jgi:signal transduction histidine kinase